MKWTRPLCGSTSMSHNGCKSRELIEPQEASPLKPAMHVLGIDLAKRVLHVGGMDERGKSGLRQRLSRHALIPCRAQLPPVRIGREAWGGAHDWARRLRAPGPAVKRMAPPFVQPESKSNTHARRDAAGMGAAGTRPPRRFGPSKDGDHQASQALQRGRERLRGARPALVPERHGLRHADGLVVPQGGAKLRPTVGGQLEAAKATLPPLSQELCGQLLDEVAVLEKPRASDQEPLAAVATTPPAGQRLRTLPGLGP